MHLLSEIFFSTALLTKFHQYSYDTPSCWYHLNAIKLVNKLFFWAQHTTLMPIFDTIKCYMQEMLIGILRLVAGIALSDDIVAGGHKRGRKYTRMHGHTLPVRHGLTEPWKSSTKKHIWLIYLSCVSLLWRTSHILSLLLTLTFPHIKMNLKQSQARCTLHQGSFSFGVSVWVWGGGFPTPNNLRSTYFAILTFWHISQAFSHPIHAKNIHFYELTR